MSAILKQKGHKVDLFDTTFIKTKNVLFDEDEESRVHGGTGLSDKGGVGIYKKTEYTINDLVRDDPVVNCENAFQDKINNFKPDIIAISCMTSTFDFACKLLRSVKHKAIVVVGGVHATIAYNDCVNQDCIDFAFIGESDITMLEFVESLEKNIDHRKVHGLTYKDKNGKTQLCHTLNGSALALPRIYAALIENNQTSDGVKIPKALQPYTGFDIIK